MRTICFVSYEIHPTTPGGCGVLLHHAAELLLRRGRRVIFLLDVPRADFERFDRHDRAAFSSAGNCRAYDVQELAADMPAETREAIPSVPMFRSFRFAWALRKLLEREPDIDYVEFFDFCGVAYYALLDRLFGPSRPRGPVLGVRLHGTIERIDEVGATRCWDLERYRLYAYERAALRLAETVLTPTPGFYQAYYQGRYAVPPERVVVSQSPRLDFPRVARRPRPGEPFRIAFVGRIFHLKGVDQLVQAAVLLMRRRPELRFQVDLIGYDSRESPLGDSQAAFLRSTIPPDLRERFDFCGHLSHARILKRLEKVLFAVFPNRFESFCYALHEVYDAGVPVIVSPLPAFRAFFEHERNALVYDGTTEGLLAAMQRMIDDPALRESLCRPYAVAEQSLGDFYDAPRALAELAPAGPSQGGLRALAVVLCDGHEGAAQSTIDSLARQTRRAAEVVCLLPPRPDHQELFWWLGRGWAACTPEGRPRCAGELLTADALAVFRAGDVPAATWLETCAGVLERRPAAAFAGTWALRGGRLLPSFLDVAPELFPFENGAMLTRTLVRTQPGRLLADLFDASLAELGEIGHLWLAVQQHGPGVLHPQPLISLGSDPPSQPEPALLEYLLVSAGGAFSDRWAHVAALREKLLRDCGGQGAARLADLERRTQTTEYRLARAEELGGRTLLKLALRKLGRRLRPSSPDV